MLKLNMAKGDKSSEKTELGEAWMMRAKGQNYEVIPVKIHIYGEIGDLDANAEAAIWMLKYSPYDKLKTFLQKYVGKQAGDGIMFTTDENEFRERLGKHLINLPFNLGETVGWTKEETAQFLLDLVKDIPVLDLYDLGDDVNDHTGDFVCKDLNETFIRVRMNDEYNAGAYNGTCYFRIGSTGKNWINQIWMFVHDNDRIKSVVVERDAESDGMEGSNRRNVMVDHMPREQFLAEEGVPFLGAKVADGISKTCYDILKNGKYSDLDSVKANSSRIQEICAKLRYQEISLNYKNIEAPWATKPMNR
jgi:hypothetical protein